MRSHADGVAFSEINVTPLVDVMLVLLIIFMVAAPLLEHGQNRAGINVTLPKAATGEASGGGGTVITLTRAHQIYLNKERMTVKELRRRLATAPSGPVVIRADRYAQVNQLIELWDLCRDAGLYQVHVATLSP